MNGAAMTCAECGKVLGRRNRSGLCQRHATIRFNRDPAVNAQRSITIRRRFATDPGMRLRQREGLVRHFSQPEVKARLREAAQRNGLAAKGRAALTPEGLARRNRANSERIMGWCPPELREEAKWLRRHGHMPLEEVKQIILDQHERDMAQFRDRLAVQSERKGQ
jgi:hypothetical protein